MRIPDLRGNLCKKGVIKRKRTVLSWKPFWERGSVKKLLRKNF